MPITRLAVDALQALHEAALIIAGSHSLEEVLQHIVDSACKVIGAKYAALGIANDNGVFETFVYSGMTPAQVAHLDHLPLGKGLLGAVIENKMPIRTSQISEHYASSGFPEGHPPMGSFLGVPIIADGEALGNLYLTNKIGAEDFTQDDVVLTEMLASHAAVAIKNAHLYNDIERLAVVEERNRIGMDLHDGVIQSIYAVGLTLETVRILLRGQPDKAEELIIQAEDSLNGAIQDIRSFILDLRPRRFEGNLVDGLEQLAREFQVNSPIELKLDIPQKGVANLPADVARALFLTAQNGLANIARHSRAQQARLRLKRERQLITLLIEDNGVGFDLKRVERGIGHGIRNMEQRAAHHNGIFLLESEPGVGTKLQISLPIA